MTPLDTDFTIFLEGKKITKIYTKSSHNANEMLSYTEADSFRCTFKVTYCPVVQLGREKWYPSVPFTTSRISMRNTVVSLFVAGCPDYYILFLLP